jgi:archaellum component FlaD/FlaE
VSGVRLIHKPTWRDVRSAPTQYDDAIYNDGLEEKDDSGPETVTDDDLNDVPEDEEALNHEMTRPGGGEEGEEYEERPDGTESFWRSAEKKVDNDFFDNSFDMEQLMASHGQQLHEKSQSQWTGVFVDSKGPAAAIVERVRSCLLLSPIFSAL